MNNLKVIRKFFNLNTIKPAEDLNIQANLLTVWENNQPHDIATWYKFSLYYSEFLKVKQTNPNTIEPIHFRFSVDYLMNLGFTVSDFLGLKWYWENVDANHNQFAVALFDEENKIEDLIDTPEKFVHKFAAYLLLNYDGKLEPFRDEFNNNKISTWQFLDYKSDDNYTVITDQILFIDNEKND